MDQRQKSELKIREDQFDKHSTRMYLYQAVLIVRTFITAGQKNSITIMSTIQAFEMITLTPYLKLKEAKSMVSESRVFLHK